MNSIGKQTIVTVLAGHEAPLEVLKLLLDKGPKQFGFAVQGKEGDEPDLSTMQTEDIPTLEDLVKMNTGTKPFNVHLYFGYIEGKIDTKNIQPFLCTDGNDNPYLSVMVEGVFSKFNEPATGTEEMNLFDKFIYPEIENILELTEGNLDKLKTQLAGDRFNNLFLSNTDHRSILHFLPLEGDPITLAKNELGESYPWGYMSQRHGYGDAIQEPEVKKVETGKKGWWKHKDKDAPIIEAKAEVKPQTSVPQVKNVGTPTASESKDKEIVAVRPPPWVHANGDLKAWYKAVHGACPGGWRKRIPVTVVNEIPDFKDLKAFQAWYTQQKTAEADTGTAALANNKTEAAPMTKEAEKEIANTLGILNKTELNKALDYVSKHLDGQSVEIPDPKTIQSMEAKIPPLSETLAFDAESYLNWPRAALFKFFHEHPTAAAMAFIEVRDMLRPFVKVKAKEKVVTTTTQTGDTKKVESVVVPDKQAEKASWWKKKTTAAA